MKRLLIVLLLVGLAACSKNPTSPAITPPDATSISYAITPVVYDSSSGHLLFTISVTMENQSSITTDTLWVNLTTWNDTGAIVQQIWVAPKIKFVYTYDFMALPACSADITARHIFYATSRHDTIVYFHKPILHQP